MMNWKRKRTPLQVVTPNTREWLGLSLSLSVAFGVVIVGSIINFNRQLGGFFSLHADQPLVRYVSEFLVVWLVVLLVMSYLRWRKETQKNAELKDIVDSISPDVLLVVDPQRNILITSVSVLRMFGRDPKEVLNKKTDVLYEDRRRMLNVKHEVYDALEREGFHIGEATGKRKDGQLFPLEIISGVLQHYGGSVLVLRDVTDRKHAEQLLRDREVQLQQSQKMESVGRLAGGVAHEFNNGLMGIMNYAELCRDKIAPDHPIREWLNEITLEAERSAKLAHQLLAFARKQTIAPQALDINDTVESTLGQLRRLLREDIAIHWKPGAKAWPVKMDPVQVDQILANLVVNARDAIGGVGLISIETGNATLDQPHCSEPAGSEPGDYVLLTVSDTGCGMDRETLGHIFEPFFTTKGVGEGTGLGLATVYGIVKQNNGFINVDSEPGKGTNFKIYLPRCVTPETAPVAVEMLTKPPRGKPFGRDALAGKVRDVLEAQ